MLTRWVDWRSGDGYQADRARKSTRPPTSPLHLRVSDSNEPFSSPNCEPIRLANWRRRVWDPAVASAGLTGLTLLRPLCGLSPRRRSSNFPVETPEHPSHEAKRIGAPSRIRTYDTRFRKPLLYPLSYGG
jgi:hypothetical protein